MSVSPEELEFCRLFVEGGCKSATAAYRQAFSIKVGDARYKKASARASELRRCPRISAAISELRTSARDFYAAKSGFTSDCDDNYRNNPALYTICNHVLNVRNAIEIALAESPPQISAAIVGMKYLGQLLGIAEPKKVGRRIDAPGLPVGTPEQQMIELCQMLVDGRVTVEDAEVLMKHLKTCVDATDLAAIRDHIASLERRLNGEI